MLRCRRSGRFRSDRLGEAAAAGIGQVNHGALDLEVAKGAAPLGTHGALALQGGGDQALEAGADARSPSSRVAKLGSNLFSVSEVAPSVSV